MRKIGLFAAALLATPVWASNLNVRVTSGGTAGTVTVAPSASVPYEVRGVLSDSASQGLALVGFDLDFTGGDLAQASTPAGAISCSNPMPNFVIPQGITNPAGFGGTVIGGNLIQVGGGQNTINNTADNAPFPIGTVVPNVAKPGSCPAGTGEIILASGTLTAPAAAGDYQLNLSNLFANVIKTGETGVPFWATEAAGAGTIGNLIIRVGGCNVNFVSASVPHNGSLWRSAKNTVRFTFDGNITAPTSSQILIQALAPASAFGPNLASGFTFSVEGTCSGGPTPGNGCTTNANCGAGGTCPNFGKVLKIRETTTALTHRTWYTIRNTGDWLGVCNFRVDNLLQVGDANADKIVTPTDISTINAGPAGPKPDNSRIDINGDGFNTPTDVSIANARIGGPVAKPSGH